MSFKTLLAYQKGADFAFACKYISKETKNEL
jgi:hypothetical protein